MTEVTQDHGVFTFTFLALEALLASRALPRVSGYLLFVTLFIKAAYMGLNLAFLT